MSPAVSPLRSIGILALGAFLALASSACPKPKMPSGPPPEYEEPPAPPWLTDAGSPAAEPAEPAATQPETQPPAHPEEPSAEPPEPETAPSAPSPDEGAPPPAS